MVSQKIFSLAHQVSEMGIPFDRDAAVLAAASTDFGHLIQGQSQLVVQPRQGEDVVALMQKANRYQLPITLRGKGCSQNGQSISPRGMTLDTSRLDDIRYSKALPQQVTCGAGATWRQLVAMLKPHQCLPCMMPLNLNLTVGGTLSAGGFGANSHRYGPAIANVIALEVVTGAGERLWCSPDKHPDLYAAVLGGQGRCAVILSATLATRPIKPQIRTYFLVYEDLETWIRDQHQLCDRIDYLEGFCSANMQGLQKTPTGRRPLVQWLWGLHVSVEFDPATPPQQEQVLAGLHYHKLLYIEDDDTADYAARYDLRFQSMQASGAWQQLHPWFDCLLPVSTATEIIPQILEILPPCFGDGHRVLWVAERPTPRFLMKPEQAFLFAVLPTGIPLSLKTQALTALEQAHQLVIEAGGKRYLSGWLGETNPDFWSQHFGPHWRAWQQAKAAFDPNHVLCSKLFP
ncbi:FAD-binding oxidoreductase [Acaryochloris sp. CCMEE 5410]|uniref:FAD-binding oxidoreductase n=1 Tax=Acaryochloris sp. CCMEE 5410 TaxID=310037 RepID=UPI0002484BE9|nr:FAD-binding oxidoreductase [Acaryochloris sp. CCMEE 5410]KAI9130825.1 FAD-binding oxidoreductase [Acaryochloris sp. CCMEE 5410]